MIDDIETRLPKTEESLRNFFQNCRDRKKLIPDTGGHYKNDKFSGVFSLDITFQLRKISQYNIDEWENLTKDDAALVLTLARKFIKFVEENL
jgi:ABC-type sulfate transport system substrate-binding protein